MKSAFEHVGFAFLVFSVGEAKRAETMLLVESSGVRIALERHEGDASRAETSGLAQEGRADAAALRLGAHIQVIEIFGVDAHIADHAPALPGHPPG